MTLIPTSPFWAKWTAIYLIGIYFLAMMAALKTGEPRIRIRLGSPMVPIWLVLSAILTDLFLTDSACLRFVGLSAGIGYVLFHYIDAVVYREFGHPANRHSISVFLKNTTSFLPEAIQIMDGLKKEPGLRILPIVVLAAFIGLCLDLTEPALFGILLAVAFSSQSLMRDWPAGWFPFALAIVFPLCILRLNASAPLELDAFNGPSVSLGLVCLINASGFHLLNETEGVRALKRKDKVGKPGPRSRSHSLDALIADLREEIEPRFPDRVPSPYFGKLGGACIIHFTMESVSHFYSKPCCGKGAEMPFFESVAGRGLRSDLHFSICPNTNKSFFLMFNGQYYQSPDPIPCMRLLKAHDYKTIFATPQDLVDYNFRDLIEDSGFDEIIDINSLPKARIRNRGVRLSRDDVFYDELLPVLGSKLSEGQKFYLHILNSQTHTPYLVYGNPMEEDKRKRYLQAVNEADLLAMEFRDSLNQWLPADDALLIYTSDHGQSFGEWDYQSHGNAVSREQINVPFAMHHPGIPRARIETSDHFDLFPTLFDLIGIPLNFPCLGQSLLSSSLSAPGRFLFSETRHGSRPSCYGWRNHREKVFFDIYRNRYFVTDLADSNRRVLDGVELKEIKAVFDAMMNRRGLMNLD